MKQLCCLLGLLGMVSAASAHSFVYISLGNENTVAVYERDAETGKLKHRHSVKTDGAPGCLAVDPDKNYVFAALRTTKQLASFRINKDTGALTSINTIDTGVNAAYVATDRSGRFLFSASYSDGKVMVHAIKKNGNLLEQPISVISTAQRAHAILADRYNKFVFVPHTGPNAIYQFHFDVKTGKLTPNAVPKVKTKPGTEPRHLAFHPKMNVVYFDNEKGSSVSAFKLDTKTGQLRGPFQTLSTLPDDFSGRNTCADIEITPNGQFLYASNRGHDSIAGFAVDGKTGKLTSIGQFATEKTPRSFNIDPAGRFLYAAGQASGKLAAYRLDPKSGRLNRFATYTVGKGPAWVMVVDF